MPRKMERKLKAQAKKKGFSRKRAGAYIYGTLQKVVGWVPRRKGRKTRKRRKRKSTKG